MHLSCLPGYDCGMYVISMAEHLIKQFCECSTLSINDTVTKETVDLKRSQIRELIKQIRREQELHEMGS